MTYILSAEDYAKADHALCSQLNGMYSLSDRGLIIIKISGDLPKGKLSCYYATHPDYKLGKGAHGSVYSLLEIVPAAGGNYEVRLLRDFVVKISLGSFMKNAHGEGWISNKEYPVNSNKHFPLLQYDFSACDQASKQPYTISILKHLKGLCFHSAHEKVLGLPFHIKANLALQVIDQLYRFHEKYRIAHCDIKPNNFLLYEDKGRYWLSMLDFGVGLDLEDEPQTFVNVPDLEKYPHLAPEFNMSASFKNKITNKTDIYMVVSVLAYVFADELFDVYADKRRLAKDISPMQNGQKFDDKYRLIKETPYTIKLGVFPHGFVKRCVKLFLFKMQCADPDRRPPIDDVMDFFRTLYQFALFDFEFTQGYSEQIYPREECYQIKATRFIG